MRNMAFESGRRLGASLCVVLAVCAAIAMLAPAGSARPALAQPPTPVLNVLPPAVVHLGFETASPVTVQALERGEVEATFTWQTVGMSQNFSLLLHYFEIDTWVPVIEESLPESGAARLFLSSTRDFSPPTYRLAIFDSLNRVVSQQIIIIPFNEETLVPTIAEFATTALTVDPVALAGGTATIPVTWQVENRLSGSNLVFEQVLPDGTARSAELPRRGRWVASTGQGVVALVTPGGDATSVTVRLRLVNVRDGEVFQEATLELPIRGAETPAPGVTTTPNTPVSIPPLPSVTPTQTLPPGG